MILSPIIYMYTQQPQIEVFLIYILNNLLIVILHHMIKFYQYILFHSDFFAFLLELSVL